MGPAGQSPSGSHATSLVRLDPPRQGLVPWVTGWIRLFWGAWLARRVLAQRARVELLRRLVIRGALLRRSPEEITAALARAMYELEIQHGGMDADLGLFGPRLFRREARAFLVATLDEF